ncbi:MAG: DNA polymerase IV [Ruminococcaceae bacterium]|nr:DNA polymerase IV [Oscillospiraceae bacterium]
MVKRQAGEVTGVGREILHCDANCFYASVEMQRDPDLRGRPVAVCGDQEARHGIVLTASYPAKKRGVKTGQAIWQAKQACPDLVVVPPDYPEYVRISGMLREIFNSYTNLVEPFGLDEAWLDVTGSRELFGSPMAIAQEISERVKFELGITLSIGVSDNKITAKLGSDYKKPDAITRIMPDNYREIVYPLPVEDLLYVGPATSCKLRRVGISTIGRLAECDEEFLQRRLGKMGLVLKTFAMGLDPTPVQRIDHVQAIKSVGNSSTAPRDLICDDDVRIMLYLLAESVALRLRELGSRCTVVEVYVRDNALASFVRQRKLPEPTCSSAEIAETAFDLFKRNYYWDKPLRGVGVRGSGLVDATGGVQLSLYADDIKRERWERIDGAMDELRRRYGYLSIQRASNAPSIGDSFAFHCLL